MNIKLLYEHYHESSTTYSNKNCARTFVVNHPFHPLYRKKYKLVKIKQLWGEHRAYYFDGSGKLLAIPINWTTLRKSDLFREIF